MGISNKDIELIEWLYHEDRKNLGQDVCENSHYFLHGKYDFCPICGTKLKETYEDGRLEN